MRRAAQLLVGIALLAGCGGDPVPTESIALTQARSVAASKALGSDVNRDLAALRSATASFHKFETAKHAGWGTQITPCMTDPGGAGGMGFHYGNV